MIILCGLPMSGKTTIGKLLAEKLNWDFLDTDQMIEKAYYQETKQNLTCREIFKKKGEGFFRSLEKEQITTLANYKNVIVALGGGSLIDEENRKFVKSLGTLIFLKTEVPALVLRIAERGMPAYINDNDPEKTLKNLAYQRVPIYESLADFVIDTTDLEKKEIINLILRHRKLHHGD